MRFFWPKANWNFVWPWLSLAENILAEGQLKQFILIEILLAEGQLKLCLALTIFSREYFGQKSIEKKKLDFLDEILLAEGQLKLCLAFTIYNREYFCWRPMKTLLSNWESFGQRPIETFFIENIMAKKVFFPRNPQNGRDYFYREYLNERNIISSLVDNE